MGVINVSQLCACYVLSIYHCLSRITFLGSSSAFYPGAILSYLAAALVMLR